MDAAYDYARAERVLPAPPADEIQASYIPVIFQRRPDMKPGSRLIMTDPKTEQLRLVFAGPALGDKAGQHPEFVIHAHDHKGRDVVHVFDDGYKGYVPEAEYQAHLRRQIEPIRAHGHAHLDNRAPYEVRSMDVRFNIG